MMIQVALVFATLSADDSDWRPATTEEIASLRESVTRRLQTLQRCSFKFEGVQEKIKGQEDRIWFKGEIKRTPEVQWYSQRHGFGPQLEKGFSIDTAVTATEILMITRDPPSGRAKQLLRAKPEANHRPINIYDPCELFGFFVHAYKSGDLAHFLATVPVTVESSSTDSGKYRVTAEFATKEERAKDVVKRNTFVFDATNDMNLRYHKYEYRPGGGDYFEVLEFGRTQGVVFPRKAKIGGLSDRTVFAAITISDFRLDEVSIDLAAIKRLETDPNVTFADQVGKKSRLSNEEADQRRRDTEEGAKKAKAEFDAVMEKAAAGEAPSAVGRPAPTSLWWYFLTPAVVALVAWLLWRPFGAD